MATEQELQYLVKVNDRDLRELKKRVADTNKALGDTSGTNKRTDAMRRFVNAGVKPAIGVLGALTVGAYKSVRAASDQNEALNKATVVFGKSAAGITAWSKTTADALGIARTDSLSASATFGQLFTAAGQADQAAAGFSKRFVTAAADLASFHNADPSDVLEALRSGLSGETEPLRRFGIFINEARVKAEAYRLGIAKQGAELTDNQKILARQQLILGLVGDAEGDFNRTRDQGANLERRVRAELADTSAELGNSLLPAQLKVLQAGIRFVDLLQRHQTAAKVAVVALAGLASAFLIAKAGFAVANSGLLKFIRSERVAAAASRAFAVVQGILNVVLAANPIVLIVAALVALGAAFVIAYKKSETFRNIVHKAFEVVKLAITPLRLEFELWLGVIRRIIDAISTVVSKLGFLKGAASKVGGFLSKIPGLAGGGTVTAPGTVLVGEAGPELLRLPRGASVVPLDRASAGAGGGVTLTGNPFVVRSDLDARLVGSAVARKLALA